MTPTSRAWPEASNTSLHAPSTGAAQRGPESGISRFLEHCRPSGQRWIALAHGVMAFPQARSASVFN
jgi:hypothetical protein